MAKQLFRVLCGSALAMLVLAAAAHGQLVPLPNPTFALGEDAPEGWRLSEGEGGWTDDAVADGRAVYVVGEANSQTSTAWRSEAITFEADAVYRLRVHARRVDGSGGSPIIGPTFANRDLHEVSATWQPFTSYFVAPSESVTVPVRLGQWNVGGTIAYDDVSLMRVTPVYRQRDGIALGDGERIVDGGDVFVAPFAGESANHARVLRGYECYFNKPRWVFSEDSWVSYAHHVAETIQKSGSITVTVGHHTGGVLVVEVRTEDAAWVEIATQEGVGTLTATLPASLFPASEVQVRFSTAPTADAPETRIGLQVNGYTYQAALADALDEFEGGTRFVSVPETDDTVKVNIMCLGETMPGGANTLQFQAWNMTDAPVDIMPRLKSSSNGCAGFTATIPPLTVPPATGDDDAGIRAAIPYDIPGAGDVRLVFDLGDGNAYRAEAEFHVPVLHETRYGALLPDTSDAVALWWAPSGWKVSRTRSAPRDMSDTMRLQAARNEREAVQLVLRPQQPLHNLRVTAQALHCDTGETLPAEAVELLLVGYVPVSQPTDYLGVAGAWPDPLPPLDGPIDLAANENQPLWLRVQVDKEAAAGIYRGAIRLEADGWHAEAPLEVEVFDFTLPDRKSCVTAFGFDAALAFQYHNVDSMADRRAVYDSYLTLLSEHNISLYNPTHLDPIEYSWPHVSSWHGGERDPNTTRVGGASLLLRDESATGNVGTTYDTLLSIPEAGMEIAFDYKTAEPEHQFMVTLLHYDRYGTWIRGQNKDILVTGDGTWQRFEKVVESFPEAARDIRVRLWATVYCEEGKHTGGVWIDTMHIRDWATDKTLLDEEFAPHEPEDVATLFVPEFDWEAWDAAMTRAYENYHINSFRLRIPGLGSGTFHSRQEPSLLGYAEDTIEYQTAFRAWCQAAEAHLRERGWLDDAYVYWFDEPSVADYEFVMNGFRKLKEAAPGLNRMLTETIVPELVGGPNIWCPVSYNYDHDMAEERRAAGEHIWWYVCTGPKAPYATLFIDHPATALRIWLWQTWERSIDGVLVWQTNYWTSAEAYPDAPQNPYKDPMAWVTSYGTPVGTRRPWGNGDGRFVYPPLAAADGQPDAPVLDPPVGSIRLDMLRDGIEDYEYFAILSDLVEEHGDTLSESDLERYRNLLEVPADVTMSMTAFTHDPAPMDTHREAVARAIVRLKALQ